MKVTELRTKWKEAEQAHPGDSRLYRALAFVCGVSEDIARAGRSMLMGDTQFDVWKRAVVNAKLSNGMKLMESQRSHTPTHTHTQTHAQSPSQRCKPATIALTRSPPLRFAVLLMRCVRVYTVSLRPHARE